MRQREAFSKAATQTLHTEAKDLKRKMTIQQSPPQEPGAYQEKSSDLPYFLRADLRVDNLRSATRFQDLLRRMNFPK